LKTLEELDGFEYTTIMLKYLLNDFNEQQGEKFINELRPYLTSRLEREMMTIGEQLKQQGIQQGFTQGDHARAVTIAKNMLTRGLDLSLIREMTGLSDQDMVEFIEPAESK